MADVLLNGREPLDRELPAIGHGRQCERERDLVQLAGLLAGEPAERAAMPVTGIAGEVS